MEISELEKLLQGSTPGDWYILEVGGESFVAAKPTPDHPYFGKTRHMEVDGDEDYPRKKADQLLKAAAPSLAAELLSLKQQNEWIPVSPETMPRGGELVLLWDSWELCIESGFLTRDADEVATFRLERSNPQDELIEYGIERVTKWQHYPSPPIATQVAG